jgi:Ni/Co efflux regulator RcnB
MKKLIVIGTATLFFATSFAFAAQSATNESAGQAQSKEMQLAWNNDHHGHKKMCKEHYHECMENHHHHNYHNHPSHYGKTGKTGSKEVQGGLQGGAQGTQNQ